MDYRENLAVLRARRNFIKMGLVTATSAAGLLVSLTAKPVKAEPEWRRSERRGADREWRGLERRGSRGVDRNGVGPTANSGTGMFAAFLREP